MADFSNTTTKTGLIQRCEDYTGIGDGNISGDSTTLKKFTGHINEAVYDLQTEILQSQDGFDFDDPNFTDYPIGTFALTTNRDYSFPASLNFLKLKRLDVTYDGVTWVRATPIDSADIEALGNATHEDANFSTTEPKYDPKANGFWLYPRATSAQVSAGASARIEFVREWDEFTSTDTTQEPPIARPFHDLVCIRASMKWAVMKDSDKYATLEREYQKALPSFKAFYGKKNGDEQLVFTPQIPSYR